MKIPELCQTCKYLVLLAHGYRCRKRMRVRCVRGEVLCSKYRRSKRFQ